MLLLQFYRDLSQ